MRRPELVLAGFLFTACSAPPVEIVPPPDVIRAAVPGDICAALMSEEALPQPPSIPDDGDGVIRILAFGDFGEQSGHGFHPENQKNLAAAMRAYDAEHPFDFGLTLGDNFYRTGLDSSTHPRWETQWEQLYSQMSVRIYATLGNHDYLDADSPNAEMERSRRSSTWCLPRPRYTFTAGPVQLFAVDTTPVEEPERDPGGVLAAAQKDWLTQALAGSQATWKVVYGHHPIYSNGHHGFEDNNNGTLPRIKQHLLSVLTTGKADVYLAGHDHDVQALEPEKGVHFYVSGAAGRRLREIELDHCKTWDKEMTYGFTVFEAKADGSSLTVSFLGLGEGGQPYKILWGPVSIQKGANTDCPERL